jgi:hypothetical protein
VISDIKIDDNLDKSKKILITTISPLGINIEYGKKEVIDES